MSMSGSAMPRCMVGLLYLSVRGARRAPKQSRASCSALDCFVAPLSRGAEGFAPRKDDSINLLPQPRDRLEIALVLAGEAQYEMRAAGAHVFVEPLGDPGRGPGVAHLPLAQHRRGLAVVALEEPVELLVRPGDVVVEHDVEIHAPRQRVGVAPGRARDVLDLAPLPAPLCRVRGDRHPAVEIAPDRKS